MSVEIKVPSLGESISEATIAKWYKKVGDSVQTDELILELETEKVTLEINAAATGVIELIKKKEEETVEVGQVIGSIKEGPASAPSDSHGTGVKSNPVADDNKTISESISQVTNIDSSKSVDLAATMPPSVRKIVAENNLNPQDIKGTGKDGRINKADALNALSTEETTDSIHTVEGDSDKPVEIIRMSRLRKTVAKRLKDSQNTAAILSTFNEINMSEVIAMRTKYRDEFQKKHGVKLGFMSFFTKAVCHSLKEIPSVNSEIKEDNIIYKKYYDIGIAVGTEKGLVVPVVRNADRMGFAEIENNIASLALKAREGKLSMSELIGGTFSITNGGIYGSLLSTPIINPPQAAILGLHTIQERPIAVDGEIEIHPMMNVTLSYDHRVIDGKDAVVFLVKIKEAVENPEKLLLDL